MPTMTDNAVVVQFANACKANVHQKWTTFAAGRDRAQKLLDITMVVLDTCKVPQPRRDLDSSLGGASGLFDFTTWTLKIDQSGFGAPAVPERDAFLTLATLIYHEARHCEQWFHMARYLALGPQVTAQTLAASMNIPQNVASLAMTNKMGPSDPMLALTRQWLKSVYGVDATFREINLRGLMLKRVAPGNAMNNFYQGFHARYSGALPEEKDAWAIQDLVGTHYRWP